MNEQAAARTSLTSPSSAASSLVLRAILFSKRDELLKLRLSFLQCFLSEQGPFTFLDDDSASYHAAAIFFFSQRLLYLQCEKVHPQAFGSST